MKLSFGTNPQQMTAYLQELMAIPVHKVDPATLRVAMHSIAVPAPVGRLPSYAPLDNYTIFPTRILRHLSQWAYEGLAMQVGDTIAQQIILPPVGGGIVCMICGVRITDIFRSDDRVGFAYTTLAGHVEQGISTFSLHGLGPDAVFTIHTLSRPALPGGKLLAPLLANPYQAWCTRQALAHVWAQLSMI
jgi:hypothetical protein